MLKKIIFASIFILLALAAALPVPSPSFATTAQTRMFVVDKPDKEKYDINELSEQLGAVGEVKVRYSLPEGLVLYRDAIPPYMPGAGQTGYGPSGVPCHFDLNAPLVYNGEFLVYLPQYAWNYLDGLGYKFDISGAVPLTEFGCESGYLVLNRPVRIIAFEVPTKWGDQPNVALELQEIE